MEDRFYTEGDALYPDNDQEDFEFLDEDSDDDTGLLAENAKTGDPRDRVHTQEQEDDEFFDANNYKGIYYDDNAGENEKNH